MPTSSDSFELRVRQGATDQTIAGSFQNPAVEHFFPEPVSTDKNVELEFCCQTGGRVEVRCGRRTLLVGTRPGERMRSDITSVFRDLHGDTVLEVVWCERETELAREVLLATVIVEIQADAATQRLRERILQQIQSIHGTLAHDILGGASARMGWARGTVEFDPGIEYAAILKFEKAISASLATISQQPSSILSRQRTRGRWAPGERLDARAVGNLTRSSEFSWADGRVLGVGVVDSRRTRIDFDIEEHRQIAAGLRLMLRRARRLGRSCQRSTDLLEQERSRWNIRSRETAETVFEKRHLPAIHRLNQWAEESRRMESHFLRLIQGHEFLRNAGVPRSPLRPTPLFTRGRGYREAFHALSDAAQGDGLAVDLGGVRMRLKNLDTLFEYWSFIKVVSILSGVLGSPSPDPCFRVVDEVYRPELLPGQVFSWKIDHRTEIHVVYEHEIPPVWHARASTFGLCASLVGAPLRPDIMLLVTRDRRVVKSLVFDAKNTRTFRRDRMWDYSDYRTLTHDSHTGEQPVKWMFYLHRTAEMELCSFPGFWTDVMPPDSANILGAVPFIPDEEERVRQILERFVSWSSP